MRPDAKKLGQLATILCAGLIGALAARALGLPIPFLLGSLAVSAALSLGRYAHSGQRFWFPQDLRKVFVAVIGTMIGTSFRPEALSLLPDLGVTLTAMLLFVVVAQSLNYGIFRTIGRYDPATATFAAMPGGLIEALALGEKAGGDVETLSVQHFVRIVLVIVTVPMLFLLFTGHAVGSAAGMTLERGHAGWQDWALFAVIAPFGLWLGGRLHLPAAHLVGPMILTAGLQVFGVLDLHGPSALLNGAQLVVGAGLGANFARATFRRLMAAFALGFVSVGVTLAVASGFALALQRFVPMSFDVLLISFAPGGVTEMSLVALSLGVEPVLVTAHHLFRIVVTVAINSALAARMVRREPRE